MAVDEHNRFQDFFETEQYVVFKNYLYNYTLRKRAVTEALKDRAPARILEVGSGLSPIVEDRDNVVYSELSFLALRTLKANHRKGLFVVADGAHLPFKDGAFSDVVVSEVLEHIPDDQAVVDEIARILESGGRLVATFPHRKFYFSFDDRFVEHCRRYEFPEMTAQLERAGFKTIASEKVLGPLEKATMLAGVAVFAAFFERNGKPSGRGESLSRKKWLVEGFRFANRLYAQLARFDAFIMPRALATVMLIQAEKK